VSGWRKYWNVEYESPRMETEGAYCWAWLTCHTLSIPIRVISNFFIGVSCIFRQNYGINLISPNKIANIL
jgi:hypothetical protein